MTETNSFMDDQVQHVVRLFAQDEGAADRHAVVLTPSQATLLYWALREFVQRAGGSVRSQVVNRDYPETLRGHARVVDWCHRLQTELVEYAREHEVEVGRCR